MAAIVVSKAVGVRGRQRRRRTTPKLRKPDGHTTSDSSVIHSGVSFIPEDAKRLRTCAGLGTFDFK